MASGSDNHRQESCSDSVPVMNLPAEAEGTEDTDMLVPGTTISSKGRGGTNAAAEKDNGTHSSSTTERTGIITERPPEPTAPAVPIERQQPDFHANVGSEGVSQPEPLLENIQQKLHAEEHAGKSGVAFLSVSTGTPGAEEYIKESTAMMRMIECYETQLGYVTVHVGENVTKSRLESFMEQVKTLTLPENISRVVFHHFGHGDSDAIDVVDGTISRHDIISSLQSICSQRVEVFKIIIFDCCRLVKGSISNGPPGNKHWVSGGQYPSSTDTLVINAAEENSTAFYDETIGCGLMTYYFSEFAPKRNESIRELLVSIRRQICEVTKFGKQTQMLVYEDKLMGKCNLLAESQGAARIVPTSVHASAGVLSTNVHFNFDESLEFRVAEFTVEVSSDLFCSKVVTGPVPGYHMATVDGLTPDTKYSARIVAVYKDGKRTESEICKFTTPVRHSPFDIEVKQRYPGSPSANVTWKFNGVTSDLKHFHVAIKTDKEALFGKNFISERFGTVVNRLLPLEKHHVSVVAVYRDGKNAEQCTTFQHSDRASPEEIDVSQMFHGSREAHVKWSLPNGMINDDISFFRLSVKEEGREKECFKNNVLGVNRDGTVDNLQPATSYVITVAAIYKDGIEKERSVTFENLNRSSPSEVNIIQNVPGSDQAMVQWVFPANCTQALSHFLVRVLSEEDQKIADENTIAPTSRSHNISKLTPSTNYRVIIIARYHDNLHTEASQEHLNCELQAAVVKNVTLTRLKEDSKTTYKVEWAYENREPLLNVEFFKVLATPCPPSAEGARLRTFEFPGSACSGGIELEPSTYSITVETHFVSSGLQHQKSKEKFMLTVPQDIDVKPKIEVPEGNMLQYCATLVIIEPPILQDRDKYACKGLRLTGIKYSVSESQQQDGGNDGRKRGGEREDSFSDFEEPYSPNGEAGTRNQTQSKPISKLKPGRRFSVKLRAEYSTGDQVESEPFIIDTQPYTASQKRCYCFGYISLYCFLATVLLSSLFLCSTYGPYQFMFHRHPTCTTDYVLAGDSVQCGSANSRQYGTIQVGGDQQQGDSQLSQLHAWSVKESSLITYSNLYRPVTVKYNNSKHQPILLPGWQIYLRTGSIIYGYCCITNNGLTEVTAKLYIFTSDLDAIGFVNGQGAQNSILHDSIEIPPSKQQCFQKWGPDRPFMVHQGSYHFIGVDMPGNVTYSTNVTVLQRYVNGSDYGKPQYFQYNNATEFSISKGLFSHENYVVICKAPFSQSKASDVTQKASPHDTAYYQLELRGQQHVLNYGAGSLHLTSCNKPHYWMNVAFPTLLGLGLVIFLIFVFSCSFACFRMCKWDKERLFLSRFTSRSHRGYTAIQ